MRALHAATPEAEHSAHREACFQGSLHNIHVNSQHVWRLPSINPTLPSPSVIQGRQRLLLYLDCQHCKPRQTVRGASSPQAPRDVQHAPIWMTGEQSLAWEIATYCETRSADERKPSVDLGVLLSFALMSVLLRHGCC